MILVPVKRRPISGVLVPVKGRPISGVLVPVKGRPISGVLVPVKRRPISGVLVPVTDPPTTTRRRQWEACGCQRLSAEIMEEDVKELWRTLLYVPDDR